MGINHANRIITKYPNKIPLIIKTKIPMERKKFLVSDEITLASFMFLLRTKYMRLNKNESLYIFFNNIVVNSSSIFSRIYTNHKSDDGFLYATVVIENTFG
jgi:hypothetical protein